ncbi:hypothetical protein NBRC116592_30810 [Colwellia sp. KU-HH00111]|uniref:hypothetical protein n=1 Tax=Colwellia sp. KU-HH00111 TaxID=3127652 RepID=UPI003106C133
MGSIQKYAGCAAIGQAVIYITAFIFFGAFWHYPVNADNVQKLVFLSDNQLSISLIYFTMYVLFGLFLSVLVLGLHHRLKSEASTLSQMAAIFGIIWVGLVIASGMIANIGLGAVIDLSDKNPEQAISLWITINTIVEGLGGGNEIVGGLWVLLVSVAGLKSNEFPKWLNSFGLFIGGVGVLTLYPTDILTEIFGLGQILWFSWLGVNLLTSSQSDY